MDVEEAQRIAANGWIYGYPFLENYRTMYPQAVDSADPRHVGGFGVYRHYYEPFSPANTDVVTPNNDTPYSWGWLDLRAEPYVVTVPAIDRYYILPFWDIDTTYVGYVGARTTGQGPGSYLISGPGWNGPKPEGITGVLNADSSLVGSVGRTYLAGPQDVEALRAIQREYRLQPLSEFLGEPAPEPAAEPQWPVWREEALGTVDFFRYLDFLLGFFSEVPEEAGIRADLAKIGVTGRGTFDPSGLSAELVEAIERGVADGRAALTKAGADATTSTGYFGTRAELHGDYLTRSMGVEKGLYGLPSEEAYYAGWVQDSAGDRPDGARKSYTIHFPAGKLPPARFFWSATMYRLPERLLADNPVDRYSIGDRSPGLVYDPDGGLTLYVQHDRPADAPEANWLPAPAGPFTVIIRLYGPDGAVLAGDWTIPALTPR